MKFDQKHLSRNIYSRLKKNVSHFRQFFKIEKGISDSFKLCKKCENKWFELNKIVDKQKIKDFLEKMKNIPGATLVHDDENIQNVQSPSGTQEKQVENKKESKKVQSTWNQQEVTTAPDDMINEQIEPMEDSRKEQADYVQPGLSVVNDENSKKKKEEGKITRKDYSHWNLLANKIFFSDVIGPKFREEFKYYVRKMKEAEKNGFADDEVKDYKYWCDLFAEKFKSNASGTECTEDLKYYLKMMKETKKDQNPITF